MNRVIPLMNKYLKEARRKALVNAYIPKVVKGTKWLKMKCSPKTQQNR